VSGPPDLASLAAEVQHQLDQKTKPVGALGSLERLCVALALAQEHPRPQVDPARVIVFAADHGVTRHGVSAYPPEVTAQMVLNFAHGGAAINVLARAAGASLEVVDVGVAASLPPLPQIVSAKVRRGSRDLLEGPAMSPAECVEALAVGARAVDRARADGVRCLVLGEMGIGNTTAAACLLAGQLDLPVLGVVGRGTGLDGAGLKRKREVVRRALALHAAERERPEAWLAAVGGLEIAALTGAMLRAHALKLPVLVDGYIVTAAATMARALNPAVAQQLIHVHVSAERGHRLALKALGVTPLLDLDLRLGEASGAILGLPLARSACAILHEMASFASAGVSGRVGT